MDVGMLILDDEDRGARAESVDDGRDSHVNVELLYKARSAQEGLLLHYHSPTVSSVRSTFG